MSNLKQDIFLNYKKLYKDKYRIEKSTKYVHFPINSCVPSVNLVKTLCKFVMSKLKKKFI